MAFKMKGMHHGEGTESGKAFKKASAFKEVPGGGPSVRDKINEKRAERAGKTRTKTHRLFGRTWDKTKEFDEEGRKIGKRTQVRDQYGELIGDTKGKGTLKEYLILVSSITEAAIIVSSNCPCNLSPVADLIQQTSYMAL